MGSNNETFSARIDAELIDLLKQRARENDRGVGAELNRILRAALLVAHKRKGGKREQV